MPGSLAYSAEQAVVRSPAAAVAVLEASSVAVAAVGSMERPIAAAEAAGSGEGIGRLSTVIANTFVAGYSPAETAAGSPAVLGPDSLAG